MFWRLTLKEYSALMECHRAGQERDDWRFANLYAVIWNTSGASKPRSAADFMPSREEKPSTQQDIQLTDAQFIDKLRIINAAHGGKEIRLGKERKHG